MKALRLDEIWGLLPELPALRPLLDRIVETARPDQEREWSASGELGTVRDRLADLSALERELPGLLDELRGRLQHLFELVTQAMRCLSKGDPEGASDALVAAAELESEGGRMEEAEAFASAAIGLASRFRDRSRALPALIVGARVARARGRWREADRRYRNAERLAEAVGKLDVAARAAVGRGNLAIDRGLWADAERRYARAEELTERTGARLPEGWHIALNRSIVAREEGRLSEAEAELERARRLMGDAGEEAEAIVDNGQGQLSLAWGRPEEAEFWFRAAIEKAMDPDAVVSISANLSEALLLQGHALEAGEILREAEEVALRRGVIRRLPEIYSLLGRIADLRGHADAFVLFERALEVVVDHDLPEVERARVVEAYALHELAKGDREGGLARLAEARGIYAELGHEAASRRVAELEARAGEEEA
jgi:tetratricopeptide (TPR) repeat protein